MKKQFNKIWKRNQVMITALACMIAIAGYLNFTGKELKDESLYTTSAQFEEITTADNATQEDINLAENEADESASLIYDISDDDINQTADIQSLDEDIDLSSADYLDEETVESMASAEESVMEVASEDTDSLAKGAEEGENPGEAVFTSTTGIVSLAEANLMREQVRAQNKETLLDIINNTELSEAAKADAINSMIALTETAQKECDAEILLEAKGFENAVVSISGDSVDVMIAASELTDAQRAQIEDIVKRKTEIAAENIIISPVGNE
jgi:stage III sporulation protein AH